MIRVMIFKGHCLARKDIVRESSYFCSRLSSVSVGLSKNVKDAF